MVQTEVRAFSHTQAELTSGPKMRKTLEAWNQLPGGAAGLQGPVEEVLFIERMLNNRSQSFDADVLERLVKRGEQVLSVYCCTVLADTCDILKARLLYLLDQFCMDVVDLRKLPAELIPNAIAARNALQMHFMCK